MTVTTNFLLGKLPGYEGKKVLLKNNQSTDDIITEMIKAHKMHKDDYDKISDYFWKGNLKNTCQFIFDFLKKNVKYSVEPDERQSVKSPAGILSTGYYKNGFNDCKHYSQFFSGILDSLKRKGKKIDWFYRFANYRFFTTQPQHVFVVANDENKNYWCDAVLDSFNERKPYLNKVDKKINMALYSISGLNQNLSGGIGRRKKAPGTKKKKGGFFKKVKGVFAKVNLAPSRAAFLAIIKLNPFKIANTLYAKLQNPATKAKLLKKWKNLGGNPKTFEKTIISQYKHWAKRKGKKVAGIGAITAFNPQAQIRQHRHFLRSEHYHDPRFIHRKMAGIGVIQVAAVLAVALPIITALAEFLPKGMKNKAEDAAAAAPEIAQAQQETNTKGGGQFDTPAGTTREAVNVSASQDPDTGDTNVTMKEGLKFDPKTLLIIAGLGVGAVLISKKH